MLRWGWVRGLFVVPIVFQLCFVQTAQAATTTASGNRQAGASSSALRTASSPSPSPTPAAPDQSQPSAAPSATSPTGSSSTAPSGSPAATTTQTNATALRREVFGYATAGSLGDPSVGYTTWNFDLLSTVAFFSINVRYDGQLVGDSNFSVWDSSTLTNMVSTAHAHGTKVVVTITGPSDTVDMCDALYNDSTTIQQLMPQITGKGVDGVNIDYEGQLANCTNVTNPSLDTTNQALITKLAKDMRAALDAIKPGYYLSIATYSGSAAGTDGFFNIPNLNQYVDSFFVMAYDMDYANQPYAPLNCSSFCMAPVSPLSNYYWNDTTSMSQYSSVVGAGKTILGQPYYGRVACVASPADHATATRSLTAATYIGAAAVSSSPDVQPGTFAIHRDADDPSGMDRWDSWYDNSLGCWRVMHWSDTTTLGVRYNLVNQMNLRGVGLWTLNYGGGSSELWSTLQTYFKGCYAVSLGTTPASTALGGTAVTISASATCPDPGPSYEFFVLAPGASSYQVLAPYSTANTYTWNTAGLFPGTYRLAVWARDSGSAGEFSNSLGTLDVSTSIPFTITTEPCSSVGLTAAPASATNVGGTVTFTASASGCPNPQYQFYVMSPGATSFSVAQAYSTGATYTFNTTNKAPGAYVFAVWARDTSSPGVYGNSLGRFDASTALGYRLNTCTGVSLSAAPSAAAAVGASVTLTATASGCPNPSPVYQFWTHAPGASAWQVAQSYSTSNTFTWSTAGKAAGTWQLAVWARDANSGGVYSNSFGTWDAVASQGYTLTTCSGVNLSSAPASPAGVGSTVTFTAAGVGCPDASPQFQFWVLAPGATSWTMAQAYSTTNTFSWSTSGKTPGSYQVAVWVRDANSGGFYSNSFGTWDAVTSRAYSVTTCTGLTLSATPSSSATAGTTVTFTASASGCPNPSPDYQFWMLAPGATSWTVVQAYSTSNTFSWTTTGKPTGPYKVAVWARDASSAGVYSNSFGTWDVFWEIPYSLK